MFRKSGISHQKSIKQKTMKYLDNILQSIGNTPLVKINKLFADCPATILAKVETFNPGHSTKDRMALKMLEDAETSGKLKPGGTIIECTSGNTGMGLVLAGAVKGYKCIFTTSDKQSKEKLDTLKALGAEVIVCPTNVTPDDPKSYYSVAERLSKEIPNSFWFNQYDNPSNARAHYESTGPEIWEQTEGKITHFVVGVGTGGTISGVGKYLKGKNPDIKIWGIDTYGSVFKKYHETGVFDEKEIYPYITEGIGEDILPKNVDFSLIDHFEKVTDKDGAVFARKLAREEGLLMGYSAGSAVAGLYQLKDQLTKDDVVVVLFHDHGSRYTAKIYNDDWMRDRGFLDNEMTVKDIISGKKANEFIAASPNDKVGDICDLMRSKDISQIPVFENDKNTGTLIEKDVLQALVHHEVSREDSVASLISKPLPVVEENTSLKEVVRVLDKGSNAVLAKDKAGSYFIISNYDLLQKI